MNESTDQRCCLKSGGVKEENKEEEELARKSGNEAFAMMHCS